MNFSPPKTRATPEGYLTLVLPNLFEVTISLPTPSFSLINFPSSVPPSNKFTRKPLCYKVAVFKGLCYYQEKENGYLFNF